ncbi:nuclear pore complex subunit [Apiospora aurea]|uniref:Nuclear pore complex subunit n=1 Tax=Apiospora aurea TaxID=335848 RepID=A0ABR1QBV9_9PEZI
MAFGFGNVGNALGPGPAQGTGAGSVNQGPDLEVVSTETLGFLSIAGDAKVRFTSAWSPAPAQNASLLTIASRKGLVAAAGPDGLTIATTENVRKAFSGPKDGDSEFRSFNPELKLPVPTRICQLTFTADENYLILSAENGGGLAVYNVETLLQGPTNPAFEIPTNGESLRALIPNPMPEKGELCAVVTDKGNLLIADMKNKDFVAGKNGQILKDQVSCAAWSTKGKQLVAGLGDGTIQQMTPTGDLKATIPKPPSLNGSFFVSFLAWLENDLFLSIHVSTAEQPPQSCYHLITRQGPNFNYQKMTDPVDPFGSPKVPHHTAARLKDFDPNLQDLLVFSSTATPDIGLMSRSKTPLTSEMDAAKITGVFTTTELADDSKRATLPMGESPDSGLPVGTALDLSSKEPVYKPIPTDEMEQSAGPLPGYWVLNDEGVLSAWWIIYNESIRAGTTYRNLVAAEASAPAIAQPAQQNAFGAPSTTSGTQAQPSPFGAASASPFGAPSSLGKPAFGGPSALGAKSSPWSSQPASSSTGGAAFGSSSFGGQPAASAPKFGTPSFGQQSGIGAKASPWATASTATSTPAFGQSGFASAAGTSKPSGGFASFANQGGFAALSNGGAKSGTSIFASSKPTESSMETNNSTSFPPPSSKPAGASNVFGSQPFKLTSSFQPDPNQKADEGSKEASSGGTSMFGSGFASAIGEAAAPLSPGPFGSKEQSTTPTTTPAPSKFFSQTAPAPSGGGLFGQPSKPTSSIFGAPKVKEEPGSPKPLSGVPSAPLPPDSTSKTSYPLGESSSSSTTSAGSPDSRKSPEEAPLPPSFPTSKSKPAELLPLPSDSPPSRGDDIPLPPDPSTNKKVYDVKFPPLPGEKEEAKPKPKPEASDDAPLPPDPTTNKKVYDVKFQPVPGVASQPAKPSQPPAKARSVFDREPPKSTGMFMFPTNPPPVSDSEEDDESDEGEAEDASEAGTEGSGVDVAKDLSPPPESKDSKDKSPGFTPQSSFDGLGGSFSTISRPEPERKSLFGNTGQEIPTFPQPNPISPRSPSPIRGAIPSRVMGSEQTRSFSAPGMASQLLGASQRTQSRPISGRESVAVDSHIEQQRKAREKKEAEEAQLLIDEEDERKQELLNANIKPALTLDEFIAHAGPAPAADNNIPAQVEAVYRDINAMIDTLGLNGRSLANFIAGHSKAHRHERREKDDLSNSDDWTIGELEDLSRIISRDLAHDLREARITDAEDKVAECQDLLRDLIRDRSKRNDLQKIIHARFDPDQATANWALPLTTEQAGRQGDLRRDLAHFTRLLAETEESLTMLRAKIAAAGGANGKGGPVPTIDAVVRTITKMTAMAEKRSGDVDLLENRMRSLRFASPGTLNFGSSTRSREGSPFNTPKKQLTSSFMFSPDRSFRESTPGYHPRASAMRHSLSASVASIGGGMFAVPPRKKMSGFGEVEKKAVKERRARRAVVLGKVRNAVEQRGPVVIALDETD